MHLTKLSIITKKKKRKTPEQNLLPNVIQKEKPIK
jgi:hypothetical protein